MEQKISYKTLKTTRKFGIEIELSKSVPKPLLVKAIQGFSNYKVYSLRYVNSVNNKVWHVKPDATCDEEGGWEIASFVGRGPHDINHISNVTQALKEVGAEVNPSCGLHIHAEAIDFSPKQVGIFLAYWIKIELIILSMLPAYRNYDYCFPLTTLLKDIVGDNYGYLFYTPERLYEYFTPIDEDDEAICRYRTINILNYYKSLKKRKNKRQTIELRCPEGTLDENNITGWLRLYLNFIEYVKLAQMPSNVDPCDLETAMIYLGLNHDSNNFYLFGPSLNKTRIWFLNRLIKNGGNSLKNDARKILRKLL